MVRPLQTVRGTTGIPVMHIYQGSLSVGNLWSKLMSSEISVIKDYLAFFVADLACLDAAVENLDAPYEDHRVPWVDRVVSALGVDGMASVL